MDTTDRALGQNLKILSQLICNVCLQNTLEEACPEQLSRNNLMLLKILCGRESLTVSALGQAVGVSSAAATKNVDRLERLGFVRRWTREDDRRCHEVAIEPAGRNVVQLHDQIHAGKQVDMFRSFSPEQKRDLLAHLDRLLHGTLTAQRNADVVCLQCDGSCQDVCFLRDVRGDCMRQPSSDPASGAEAGREPSGSAGTR